MKNTYDSLAKNTSAGSIVCQLFTSIARDSAGGGGEFTKAIERRGRTALSRRCQCGRDCLRLGVARGRRREVAQMIRLIG